MARNVRSPAGSGMSKALSVSEAKVAISDSSRLRGAWPGRRPREGRRAGHGSLLGVLVRFFCRLCVYSAIDTSAGSADSLRASCDCWPIPRGEKLTVNTDGIPEHGVKEVRDALPVVRPADSFCEDVRDVHHLDLVTSGEVVFLRQRVGDHQLRDVRVLDLLERVG